MESSIKTKLGEIEEITMANIVGLITALSNKLSKQETSQVIDVDGLSTSFEYVSQSSSNAPSWATNDGAVLTMKGTSNRQLWIGRDGEIGFRGGTGATAYTDAWIQLGTKDWVIAQNFLKQVNWGDVGGSITNQTDLNNALKSKGVQITADQPNAMIHLKDASGNIISSLNVGFLNNEGTTIHFNTTTEEIELKNDAGTILSSFPASALVANMPDNLNLNGTSLELRDVSNNVLSSVDISMNLGDLSNVSLSGLSHGDILINDAGTWVPIDPETLFDDYSGFVKKIGDTMTGSLVFDNGSVKILVPEVGSTWTGTIFLSEKATGPWNARMVVKTFASGAFKLMAFMNEVNEMFFSFNKDGLRIGEGGEPRAKADIEGDVRIDEMPNLNTNFVRWDPEDKILKERTVAQTKFDLGITRIARRRDEPVFDLGTAQNFVSAYKGEEPANVIFPQEPEDGKEYSVTVSRNVQLLFPAAIQDLDNETTFAQHLGSVKLLFLEGVWYKVGGVGM